MIEKVIFVLKVARDRGLGFFVRYFYESIWFDLRYGTNTSSRVTKDKQSIMATEKEEDDGLLYVASFNSVVRKTLNVVKGLLGESMSDAQFVDLGCGKGKTIFSYLLYMSAFRQKKTAIGIEYDSDLTTLAVQNGEKFSGHDFRFVQDSAVNVLSHIEYESLLIVYLYNSFQGDTMRQVLVALQSVPHLLIYVDPVERDMLMSSGYQLEAEHKGHYHADTWMVVSKLGA